MSQTETYQDMPSLIAMAREGTSRSRQILAENVLDMVISRDGRLSDRERALSDQVLTRLVQDMELQVRQQLARRLADAPQAPDLLLEMLAKDEISVAGPLLERSLLLKDTILIEIVQLRMREHQLCIAMREVVSVAVSDALVEHASGPDVLEALIRNPNAAISKTAMAYLVAESRRLDQFQEPLLLRADLPAALAQHMFWWVSAQLRQKILTDFAIEDYELDPLIEDSTHDILAEMETERQDSGKSTALALASTLNDNGQLKVETIIGMLRNQRIQAFCASMSIIANVSFATINRIILDKDITPFAVLCKAVKFSEAHFSTMALLLLQTRNNQKQSVSELRNVLDLFKEISSDQAKLSLSYWHSDSALQKAVNKIG